MGIIHNGSHLTLPPKAVRHLHSLKPERAKKGLEDIKNFLEKEGLGLETFINESLKMHLIIHTGRRGKLRPVSTFTLNRIKDVMNDVFESRPIRPSSSPFIKKQEKIAFDELHPDKPVEECDPARSIALKAMTFPMHTRSIFIEVMSLLEVLRCERKATAG